MMCQGPPPELSVIVPTFNRHEVLAACLQALDRQTAGPKRFEVLVVDDGSTDGTYETVLALVPSLRIRVALTRQKNGGANAARNRALARARTPLVLIINDDTIACPDLVERHLDLHLRHPEMEVAALGRMTIDPTLPFSPFHALHHDASFAQFEGREELDWTAFFTCNLSVKTFFLRCHGGFDEDLRWHEDIELGLRLSRHGLRLLYDPEALGHHRHYLDEADYLKIADREGKSLAQWFRKDPEALPELARLGLHAAALSTLEPRHRVADLLINGATVRPAIAAARAAMALSPAVGRRLYLKLFQWHKRRAIGRELAGTAP